MELRYLQAFVVVAEEQHVGRAAERLHVTQPTLSRQMAALERDLDATLFSRARRRLALTPAGETLLAGARELLSRTGDLARDVARAHRGELGTLRLGFVQSATFEALPRIVRAFRQAHPDVMLDAHPMPTRVQLEAFREGRLDVGLMRPRGPLPEPLRTRPVSLDPLVAVLPSGHPLAERAEIPLAALADEPFVFYARPQGPEVHDTIVGLCRQAGFSPSIVHEARDVQTLVSLVAADLGVSLVISPTPDPGEAVAFRPLTDDLPDWELVLAWAEQDHAPALAHFLAVANEVVDARLPG
ncbi:LysR family transcriptional regulator [Egibacter rhizosphaerae]|nr:LysR family transcriptional regulator [Egibacter rhizosphaerae]